MQKRFIYRIFSVGQSAFSAFFFCKLSVYRSLSYGFISVVKCCKISVVFLINIFTFVFTFYKFYVLRVFCKIKCRILFFDGFALSEYFCIHKYRFMKKILLLIFAWCVAFAANAQEFPYSKYLNYTKDQFKDGRFKYHKKTNTWVLNKISALNTTLNVLAIIADADEELRPDVNNYCIVAQLGEADTVAWVEVYFYNDNTYHKLLTFLKDNGEKLVETSSGKLVKHQAFYGDYALELDMEQHIISRTSARTADPKTVKNVDESYNEYQFTIRSSVKPWSEYLEKQAAKQAKRDAKGKKKQSIDDLM